MRSPSQESENNSGSKAGTDPERLVMTRSCAETSPDLSSPRTIAQPIFPHPMIVTFMAFPS